MNTLISVDNTWALWAVLTVAAAAAIYLEQKYDWANKVTGTIIALVIVMALSNLRIIPTDAPVYDIVWAYVVPLAVPMLLFNANVKKIAKESGRMLLMFTLSSLGTLLGSFIAFYALRKFIPQIEIIMPMFTGTYIGGSVNLVAMADAYNVPGEITSAAIVADNLLMAIYFFILIALPSIKPIAKYFSRPYIEEFEKNFDANSKETQAAKHWTAKPIALLDIALVVAISFTIVTVSTGLGDLLSAVIPTSNFFFQLLNGMLGSKYLLMATITMILASVFAE
ncbi:MAG: DUF819 family protein, partial [Tissierellia bacterium]|nr:DUF819 family protein [Tissierellia bacterium]